MKTITHRFILILCVGALLTATATTIGCRHTAHGAGEDIENMGEKIQEKTD